MVAGASEWDAAMHFEKLEEAREALGLAFPPRVVTFKLASESGVGLRVLSWSAGGGTCRKITVPFSMSSMGNGVLPCTVHDTVRGGRRQSSWGEKQDRRERRPPMLVA